MKSSKRAMIVDDEAPARVFLRRLLAAHLEIEVVGEACNVTEAIEQFQTLQPDLIFLDVQMPKRDGFSLLADLIPVPEIIFVTAYDCFAVRAFEANAVDYLVKPVQADRLSLALTRLRHPVKRKARPFGPDDPIFLESSREWCVAVARTVTHICADQNYSLVFLPHRKPIQMRRKMAEWARLLPSEVFFRADRSTIVNLSAVKELVSLSLCEATVFFHDADTTIQVGLMAYRRLKKALRARVSHTE